jgi:hypothetical protein
MLGEMEMLLLGFAVILGSAGRDELFWSLRACNAACALKWLGIMRSLRWRASFGTPSMSPVPAVLLALVLSMSSLSR